MARPATGLLDLHEILRLDVKILFLLVTGSHDGCITNLQLYETLDRVAAGSSRTGPMAARSVS